MLKDDLIELKNALTDLAFKLAEDEKNTLFDLIGALTAIIREHENDMIFMAQSKEKH